MFLSKLHKQAQELNEVEPDIIGADIDEDVESDEADMPGMEGSPDESIEDVILDSEPGKDKKNSPIYVAAEPHAKKAKELWDKRQECAKELEKVDSQLQAHRMVLRALLPKMDHELLLDDKDLRSYLKPEKIEEKKRRRNKKADEVIDQLIKIADVLDYNGQSEEVGIVDNIIRTFAKKEFERPIYDVENVEKKKRIYPDIAIPAPTMSVRTCPDHHGAQMQRVADNCFKCEMDGRVYNWDEGFKSYDGIQYGGGKIRSVDVPETVSRLFETREMAQSKNMK